MPSRPFTIRHRVQAVAGAATLALVVAAPAAAETLMAGPDAPLVVQGNACVGVACLSGSAPSAAFQVRNNDTPLVRLDQTSAGGFVAQAWDVAGNEANFFVRDLTGGSRLPFRIAPGAPTNNLTLRDGLVGIGTWTPEKGLDITDDGGDAALKVTETAPAVEARTLADLTNRGPVVVRLADSNANVGWTMATAADGTVALTPEGPGALPSLVLSTSGDATAGGVLQQTVDPARQTDVEAADGAAIVEAIRRLPVRRYAVSGDPGGAKHLAPDGAAFRSALGLGSSDALIAPGDVGTVALVGVKALLNGEAAVDARLGEAGDQTRALARRADDHEGRIAASEQVLHGHERRMRRLEHQATLAETRFQRSNRVQQRLRRQIASLRGENARLARRLAAVEAAVARRP